MSNKLIKNKPKEEEKAVFSVFAGKVFIVCGVIFIILMGILTVVPTNLDGTLTKWIVMGIFDFISLLLIAWGVYYVVKKPELKLGRWGAKMAVKELEAQGIKLSKEEEKALIEEEKNVKI